MADLKIDQARAMTWVKDVQNEIYLVENTLGDVKQVCETFPGDDDTVFKLIEKTGEMLDNAWTATTKAFKNAWEKLEDGVKHVGEAGERIQEAFSDFQSKI